MIFCKCVIIIVYKIQRRYNFYDSALHLKAYAKVNLGLDVLRRREDGYHEIRMIMQTVKLFDYITYRRIHADRFVFLRICLTSPQ